MNKYILLPLVTLGFMASCVDDKGSYDYAPINRVTVENVESPFNAVQGFTEIDIEPKIKGDIYDKDLSNYEFTWHVCRASITANTHNHRVIGTEKDLHWKVDEPVGNYSLYLTVKDKPSGVEELFYYALRIASPFARGFMLLGTDGNDDLAKIDMLSMPSAGDTAIVQDAFQNDGTMRKPLKIFYTGNNSAQYNDFMWLFCEDNSWKLNSIHSEDMSEFDVIGDFASLGMADNEYGLLNEKCIAFEPSRSYAYGSVMSMTRSQCFMTKDAIYGFASAYGDPYFASPANRLENSPTAPLFKFYPKIFYSEQNYSIAVYSTPLYVYNTDSDVFVKMASANYLNITHCTAQVDAFNAAWKWDCASEDRRLVWGDNAGPYSVFVMRGVHDTSKWDIYSLNLASAYSIVKEKFPVDLSEAKDFDKATHYSLIGCRRAIFYSVGSVLHQYDFQRNKHIKIDLGDEITMVKDDFYSRADFGNLMVATWNNQKKEGTFMKFKIGDNPNYLEMEIRNDIIDPVRPNPEHERYLEKWPTRLKIVDAEWRSR